MSGRLLCKDDSGRCGREHTGVGMLVGAVGRWVGWVVGSGVGAAVGCSVGEAVGAVGEDVGDCQNTEQGVGLSTSAEVLCQANRGVHDSTRTAPALYGR